MSDNREIAVRILTQTFRQRSFLDFSLMNQSADADRGFIKMLVMTTTRRYEFIRKALRQFIRKKLPAKAAFAEFAEPNLEKAANILVQQQVKEIIIVPLFLTVGNHLHRDIPNRVDQLSALYPQIHFKETKHLGADVLIVQLLEKRISEITDV